jgi:hypothetical protein
VALSMFCCYRVAPIIIGNNLLDENLVLLHFCCGVDTYGVLSHRFECEANCMCEWDA